MVRQHCSMVRVGVGGWGGHGTSALFYGREGGGDETWYVSTVLWGGGGGGGGR